MWPRTCGRSGRRTARLGENHRTASHRRLSSRREGLGARDSGLGPPGVGSSLVAGPPARPFPVSGRWTAPTRRPAARRSSRWVRSSGLRRALSPTRFPWEPPLTMLRPNAPRHTGHGAPNIVKDGTPARGAVTGLPVASTRRPWRWTSSPHPEAAQRPVIPSRPHALKPPLARPPTTA
jgi:hypothetical protein